MKQRVRHRLIYALVSILMTIWLIDVLLWKIDPNGVARYFADWRTLQSYATPVFDGYRYAPDTIPMIQYTAVIDENGFRAVPASRRAACRVVFIGDSLTFGMGSDETFVTLLAPDIDATVINAGLPSYNIENIVKVVAAVPADGYVWLVFANDDQPPARWQPVFGPMTPAIILYRDILNYAPPTARPVYFETHAADLLARADMLAVAFEGFNLASQIQAQGGVIISPYTHIVSPYDGHPSAAGHQQIADDMHDAVLAFTARQCAQRGTP